MKKTLFLLLCLQTLSCYAVGPNELTFNNVKYIKQEENRNKNTLSAEYRPTNKGSTKIVIHYVTDKNEPKVVVDGLKQKKSVEISEVQNINNDNSDLLVTFVRFDLPGSKVEQNICRIKKNTTQKGSVVFQYIDVAKMKGQTQGVETHDFTAVADVLKEQPLEEYVTTLSQNLPQQHRAVGNNNNSNVPWYDRPGAWAGKEHIRNRNGFRGAY